MLRLRKLVGVAALAALSLTAMSQEPDPRVEVVTTMGSFVIELNARRAPLTTELFLTYVAEGHYEGTIFHRVIEGFVAQGGGYDQEFKEKPVKQTVPNESGNGLSNQRGTVGLARTGEPHSGNAQFYINLINNTALDPNPARWGYAVFGKVVEGMETIDAIGHVGTGPGGPFDRDVPAQPIVIERITLEK